MGLGNLNPSLCALLCGCVSVNIHESGCEYVYAMMHLWWLKDSHEYQFFAFVAIFVGHFCVYYLLTGWEATVILLSLAPILF